jgi:Na+/H+ antiporter NhaD/arsenite permease-like protein
VKVPEFFVYHSRRILVNARILSPTPHLEVSNQGDLQKPTRLLIPFDFITAPLIAVFFLLAVRAIGQKEVHDGIIGAGGCATHICNLIFTSRSLVRRIKPIDIMALFLSLAYISISLDASGLLRFLAFWVLKKGGSRGRRLYFLLYVFFFVSGLIVGNVSNSIPL